MTNRPIAIFIKNVQLESPMPGLAQIQHLYLTDKGYIVASAIRGIGFARVPVHETFLFNSDEEGHITDWVELPGSKKGIWDCDLAMNNAGFDVYGASTNFIGQ